MISANKTEGRFKARWVLDKVNLRTQKIYSWEAGDDSSQTPVSDSDFGLSSISASS